MSNETLLVLSGPGVAPYSARGLTQTLTPIGAAANNRRSINGDLLDLSQPQFRKYASSISCADQLAPALDGVWPGMTLTVDCVAELSYKTSGGSPSRPIVDVASSEEATRTEGAYTYYRPRLTMKVMAHNQQEDEYGRVVQWSLELEEV
jgi:hypothetical protein